MSHPARLAAVAALTTLAAALPAQGVSAAVGDQATELVSRSGTGTLGNGYSAWSRISGDGRLVVFASVASNLSPQSANDGDLDVFLKNLTTRSVVHVSRTAAGTDPAGTCEEPAMSRNGQWVAFVSNAPGMPGLLFANGQRQVYLYHVASGTTRLVSASTQGPTVPGNRDSTSPDVSDQGDVAYQSSATDLVTGAPFNNHVDVFHWSAAAGNRLVSRNGGTAANGPSRFARITASGHRVVYHSDASNLIPGDGNGTTDVFVWSPTTQANSSPTVNVLRTERCAQPVLSDDGRKLAFLTAAAAFTGFPGTVQQVVLLDLPTNVSTLVSVAPGGAGADAPVSEAALSGDGTRVAFTTDARNLGLVNAAGTRHAWMRDFAPTAASSGLRLLSQSHDGVVGSQATSGLSLSADGTWATLSSASPELYFSDSNGVTDVFVGFGGLRNLAPSLDPEFQHGYRPGILRQLRPSRQLDRLGFYAPGRIRDIDIAPLTGSCVASWLLTIVTENANGRGEVSVHGIVDCNGSTFLDRRQTLPTFGPLAVDVVGAAVSANGTHMVLNTIQGTFLARLGASGAFVPIPGISPDSDGIGIRVDGTGNKISVFSTTPTDIGTLLVTCYCASSSGGSYQRIDCPCTSCGTCTTSSSSTTIGTATDYRVADLIGGIVIGGGGGTRIDPPTLLMFGENQGRPGIWWAPGPNQLPGAIGRPLYIGEGPRFAAGGSLFGRHLLIDTESRLWELETIGINTDTVVGTAGGLTEFQVDLPSRWVDGGGVFAVIAVGAHELGPQPVNLPAELGELLGSPLHLRVRAVSNTVFAATSMPSFHFTAPPGLRPGSIWHQAAVLSVPQGAMACSNVADMRVQ